MIGVSEETWMISCIVTTYKRPITILKRALDSVIHQTYEDIEIILVNDAPEDKVMDKKIRALLTTYEKPIQYILSPIHSGACGARNLGLEIAKGEYVAFLDDDDEWLPGKLEKQMYYMLKTEVALVYCSHYYVDKKGKKRLIEEPMAREGSNPDEFMQLLKCNFIGSTSYPLIKLAAVKAVGGFTKGLTSSQDHDLWLRIAREYPIGYDREPLVNLYYSADSISRCRSRVKEGYEYLLNKYRDVYGSNKKLLNYRLNYLAACSLSHGDIQGFLYYWVRACKVKPISRINGMFIQKGIKRLKCFQKYR